MDNQVILKGLAPFHLGVAQNATADAQANNGVTVTLYALIDGHGTRPIPITIQMVNPLAQKLALALMDAAALA